MRGVDMMVLDTDLGDSKGAMASLRKRKDGRTGSGVLASPSKTPGRPSFPGLGKADSPGKKSMVQFDGFTRTDIPTLRTAGLNTMGSKARGGRQGSKTERLGNTRIESLSVPNNRTMPHRPPTAAQAVLPGINNRYSRPIRTPAKERSAGERGGHAGMVTRQSRDMLGEDMVMPLLDMAAYSLNAETQNLVAPAMAALAGVASNRKVLASFGAVDVMLRLAESGKTVKVRLDAWDAVLQLIRSSQACQRLFELDGLDMAMRCSNDPHAAIRRKAAHVVARLLSKDRLKMSERTSLKNVSGLCAFVTSSDPATSLAAGAALLKVVKDSLYVMIKLDNECLAQIVHAVVTGKSVILMVQPDRTLINKGHSHALLALSMLTQDKEICSRLARAETLALVMRKLFEHGVAMGRATSEEDVYFSRIVSNLCMTCRTSDILADNAVLSHLIAAMPRLLLILTEAMPRDSHNPFKSKSSSVTINPEQLLLPNEAELQHNLVLSIGRFMFCMTSARLDLFEAGFFPCLMELSRSRTIKIRQNAAICIFYLVQDKGVQERFPTFKVDWNGRPAEDQYDNLLDLLKTSADLLVRLTVLRSIKSLAQQAINVVEFERRGMGEILVHTLQAGIGLTSADKMAVQNQQLFPLLKCAFCASDIVLLMMATKDSAIESNQAAMMSKVEEVLGGEGGLVTLAVDCSLSLLENFSEIAQSAMGSNETKKHLTKISKHNARASESLKLLNNSQTKHSKESMHDEDRLRKIFRRYDEDQSGEIDGDELYSLLRDLGHLCTRDEAMRIMSGMDHSGDGSVDFHEFESWWKNAPFTSMFASSNINR
mmetsp:Transcript_16471/g.37944  ORF Transcript_16471/g.37944 Transcript_16471/m.37944 type:complete len:825 (-) Transcript_16471:44-2518(-)